MDFNECAENLKYMKSVLTLLDNILKKAEELTKDKEKHINTFEQKFFKKAWKLQKNYLRFEIITDQFIDPAYYSLKFRNLFRNKKDRELTELQKYNSFLASFNEEKLVIDLKNKLSFSGKNLLFPASWEPTFSNRIGGVIESLKKGSWLTTSSWFLKWHLPSLENLKSEYEKECEDFILKNYQEEFDKYVQEQLKIFINDTEHFRLTSPLFNVYDYEPARLVKYLSFTRIESIKEAIQKQKIIYDLFLDPYKNLFGQVNSLTYSNLSEILKNKEDPLNLLDSFNENTLILEEYNIFTELNLYFSIYPNTHDSLVKIVIEMKDRGLIPPNIEKYLMEDSREFSQMCKGIIEKHNLRKSLESELIQNPVKNVRKKVNKI